METANLDALGVEGCLMQRTDYWPVSDDDVAGVVVIVVRSGATAMY
jgi:hypothetical protein